MFPTLFLLTGSLVAPAPHDIPLAKLTALYPPTGQRLPDPNGPDAIFRKYKIDPIPMGGWAAVRFVETSDVEELKQKLEQLQKQSEERRRQQK